MVNAKQIYNSLLSDSRITSLIPEDNILNAYPSSIETYPCIIFLDENQVDTEYNDDMPGASDCSVTIHIFSKKIDDYPSTSTIAIAIAEVMNEKLWHGAGNGEVPDPDVDVEHRVMNFNTSIYNN